MTQTLALAPSFAKGSLTVVCAFVLFVGSVYLLVAASFGRRMGYLVVATAFFSWMIILSSLWAFGVPGSTPRNGGPKGTDPHWRVFAAAGGSVTSRYSPTSTYPQGWRDPTDCPPAQGAPAAGPHQCHNTAASVLSVIPAIQTYLAAQAQQQLAAKGEKNVVIDPASFSVTSVQFATSGKTFLAVGRGSFSSGGPAITVFVYHDRGNVPVYSIGFLLASIIGFAIHVPFLDRAEKSRKAILTGGTAPAWYGPA